jgi:uncharacterized protein (UPF0210 family)
MTQSSSSGHLFRALTLHASVRDCIARSPNQFVADVRRKLSEPLRSLRSSLAQSGGEGGWRFRNQRLAITPVSTLSANWTRSDFVTAGKGFDDLALECDLEFVGGFSANIERGIADSSRRLMDALPDVLRATTRVCGFVNVGGSHSGIELNAIRESARCLRSVAAPNDTLSAEACARFAVTCNAIGTTPYMPLAAHRDGDAELVLSIAVGALERINTRLEAARPRSVSDVGDVIRDEVELTARAAENAGRTLAESAKVELGTIDVSLAPAPGSSLTSLLTLFRHLGVRSLSSPGAVAALALINDAIKRGGLAGSSHAHGLMGTLLSIAEDSEIYESIKSDSLQPDRLLALTSICATGVDMVAVPWSTPHGALCGLIADEVAIGCVNGKSTALRLIPVGNAQDDVVFASNPVFGRTRVLAVSQEDSAFSHLQGRIPPPIQQFRN